MDKKQESLPEVSFSNFSKSRKETTIPFHSLDELNGHSLPEWHAQAILTQPGTPGLALTPTLSTNQDTHMGNNSLSIETLIMGERGQSLQLRVFKNLNCLGDWKKFSHLYFWIKLDPVLASHLPIACLEVIISNGVDLKEPNITYELKDPSAIEAFDPQLLTSGAWTPLCINLSKNGAVNDLGHIGSFGIRIRNLVLAAELEHHLLKINLDSFRLNQYSCC